MRHRFLTSSLSSVPFTSRRLQAALSVSTRPPARRQNFERCYVYEQRESAQPLATPDVRSLLLLPVMLKAKLSFQHQTNKTSTL